MKQISFRYINILFNKGFLFLLLLVGLNVFNYGQQSKFIKVNNTAFKYYQLGNGKQTILLIHGMYDDALVWKNFSKVLLRKDYKIIAIERRGIKKTYKTDDNYSIKTFSEDVINLIEKLKLKNIHLIGHSYGGNIALDVAANLPNKLSSLVLIEGGFWKKKNDPPQIPLCQKNSDFNCEMYKQIMLDNHNFDSSLLIPKVEIPILLVLGKPNFSLAKVNQEEIQEQEKVYLEIIEYLKSIEKTFKKGKFITIGKAEHWVFKDQPKTLAKEILKFIEENKL